MIESIRRIALGLAVTLPFCGQAASFQKASQHLDTDGSLIGFIDFEGDGKELGEKLNRIYQEILGNTQAIPQIPIDFNLMFETLGFGSIRSIGISSKELKSGLHVNRSAVELNGPLNGVFGIYSLSEQEPRAFTAAALAPADANGAGCGPINLQALTDTYLNIMTQVMGPMGEGIVKQQLKMPIPGTELHIQQVVNALSARWDYAYKLNLDNIENPELDFLIQIEQAGDLVTKLKPLSQTLPVKFAEDEGTLTADFSAILGNEAPCGLFIKADENGNLVIFSDRQWIVSDASQRLADDPEFKSLTSHLPEKALWYSYSGGFNIMDSMKEQLASDANAAGYLSVIEQSFALLLGDFYKPTASAAYFTDEFVVTEQYGSFSTKQVVMLIPSMFAIYPAMAIPSFHKVRSTSQEKAVENNLRQIATAADQYFLENGVTEVELDQLIGAEGYIKALTPVAGENYDGIRIKMGEAIQVILSDGRVITHDF